MRLLMTTDTVGGVWTYTKDLTAELLERGNAVALVTLGRGPSPTQEQWLTQMASRWGRDFRWQVSGAPLEWMDDNERAYCEVEPLLVSTANEFGADLLHSNHFCFGALPVAIPRVVVAHSDVLSWAAACRDGFMEPCAWFTRYYALVSAGLLGADAVVTPTRWMLGALAANFWLPSERYVIANGRSLSPPKLGGERRLQAITAGRLWDEAKNLSLLAHVRTGVPILVAGEKAYGSNAAAKIPPGLTMLGLLSEAELLEQFGRSAVYLCTSLYEPFGLAPLEAALCGCAVLAHDIPSLREVWGNAALYFADASSLSAQLEHLMASPLALAAARDQAYSRARRYSARRMADGYLALYRSMLDGGRPAPSREVCDVA